MKQITIVHTYDEYARAETTVSVGDFSVLLNGHAVDMTDKRLKPLWDHLGLQVTQKYNLIPRHD